MLEPVPTERPPAADVLYLVGTSGHPNFGDEFIAASWLRFLARARPGAEVWLDCPHPGLASHLFDGLHPGLRTTDTLWRLAFETTGMDAFSGLLIDTCGTLPTAFTTSATAVAFAEAVMAPLGTENRICPDVPVWPKRDCSRSWPSCDCDPGSVKVSS